MTSSIGTPPGIPAPIYATFCDNINQASVQRIINNFALAMKANVPAAHLFFQSSGGTVGDGIALYNYFRALTALDLTVYNPGAVQSVAAIAYLGAAHRKTSANAVFFYHRTTFTFAQPAKASDLIPRAESLVTDDRRTEEIIRAHTAIPEAKWAAMNNEDMWLTAREAVEYGVADEIADFAPPVGTTIFNL